MENISMEAAPESDEATEELEPVKVLETRGDPTPEVRKAPVEQPSTLDINKLSYELQQGYRVYIELLSDSYKNVTWPFYDPVDAEALGLWDYHEKIKDPMSFFQIGCKFNNYKYNTVTEVISDIRLILENCYRFNGPDHWVSKLGQKLEKILEQKLALLNRSLRDKVSLKATMALKRNYIPEETADGASRRRCAPRSSYLNMLNGENSSSLLTHLKIQDDLEERERRRIREKEKKEANLVLLQDLAEWEEKELSTDAMKQLHSMWEIPSLAGLLFLLKDILYLHDMSVAELELSFMYANKSQLLAKIYTALLLTPHQRKSLFKKPPMKFKVWESKLSERVSSWYKAVEKEGQQLACQLCGLDIAMFDVLGDVNPLLEKSYLELTLHQRVWMLKCLCDNSLVRDYDVREQLSTISPTDQRELLLGSDSDNWQYLYFPIFSAVDLRIYKQSPVAVPSISRKKKKAAPTPVKDEKTPTRPATPVQAKRKSRLRKLNRSPSLEPESTPPPSPQQATEAPVAKNTISEGFEMIACDIEALKKLCDTFDEPPPPPKKRGRKPKAPPPRKRCEVDLHQALSALLEELEKYEASFSKLLSKAKIKIMKESMEAEPVDETEEVVPDEVGEEWGSEESLGDEIEDAGAKNMSSDEDYVLEDEEGSRAPSPKSHAVNKGDEGIDATMNATAESSVPQKRKAVEVVGAVEAKGPSASPDVNDKDDSCSIAIQTAPPRLKKKRRKQLAASDDAVGKGSQETAPTEPKIASSTGTQANRIVHIPVCLKMVEKTKKPERLSVNDVGGNEKPLSFGKAGLAGFSDTRLHPSTNSNQSATNSGLVQKCVTVGKSPVVVTQSSTASLTKTVSRLAASSPRPPLQTVPGVQCVAVSNDGSKAPSSVQPSTVMPTAVSQVMLVTRSGVPLKVVRTVPIPLPGVQVKTAGPGEAHPPGKQALPPSRASTLSHQIVLTPAKSTKVSSSVPSSTVLPSSSHLSFTAAATSPTPPVLVLQRPASGGALPLSSVKGGSLVVSAPSASQQFVILKSPTASSSFSGGTRSSGVSLVGGAQFAKTALGPKMILSPVVNVTSSAETLKQVKPAPTSESKGSTSVVLVNATSSALKSSEVTTVKPLYVTSTGMSQGENKPVLKTVASCSNSTTVLDTRTVSASSGLLSLSESNANGREQHSSPSKKVKLDESFKGSKLDGDHAKDENNTNSNDAASVDLTCYETNVSDSAGFDEADEMIPWRDRPLMTSSCPAKQRMTDVRLHNGISQSVARAAPPETEHSANEGNPNQPSASLIAQPSSNGVTADNTTP